MAAEQDGPETVIVTWTPPPAPPAAGYQVQMTVGTTITTTNVAGISHNTILVSQLGVYSIQVMSRSLHFPSETSEPVEFTVRGNTVIINPQHMREAYSSQLCLWVCVCVCLLQ